MNEEKSLQIKKIRKSNIELVKIFAIFIIIMSHMIPYLQNGQEYSIDVGHVTRNFQEFILLMFRVGGQIGNIIFLTASAYFLLDSKNIKIKKLFIIFWDAFIVSITFLIISLALKVDLTSKEIIRNIFPIIHGNNWFIGTYVLLYLCHPFLNIIIDNIDRKTHKKINIFTFLYYSIFNGYVTLFGNDTTNMSHIIVFINIYFYIAYMKKYMTEFEKSKKKNIILAIISYIGITIFLLILNWVGLGNSKYSSKMLTSIWVYNPFCIGCGLAFFNISNWTKPFYSKMVNYISSLSLIIYVIHNNRLFTKFWGYNAIWKFIYNQFTYKYLILECIVLSVITIIISVIIGTIYKETIGKIGNKLIDWIYLKCKKSGQ